MAGKYLLIEEGGQNRPVTERELVELLMKHTHCETEYYAKKSIERALREGTYLILNGKKCYIDETLKPEKESK